MQELCANKKALDSISWIAGMLKGKTGKDREEMKRIADIFRGRIVDVTESSYVIELTGDCSKLDAFLEVIEHSLVLETVRTGVCGIGRGDRILKV